jgi:hypothetical protein
MTNVALVLCPGVPRNDWRNSTYPGINYVKSMMEREGLNVTLINPNNIPNYSKQQYLEDITNSGAEAIAVSASSEEHKYLRGFTKLLKRGTNLPIGVGGFVSLLGEEALETIPHMDAMLEGEGELRSGDFFRALIDGHSFKGIDGIFYREGNNIGYTGKASPVPEEVLDEYVPNLNSILDRRWEDSGIVKAFLYSSRGCYNACSYCHIRGLHGRKVRSMSSEKLNGVIEELAVNYDVNLLQLDDDEFLFRSGRLGEIIDTLEKHQVKVFIQTRAKDILVKENQEDLLRLKKSGLIGRVALGIESFYDPALERWKKNTTAKENYEAINFLDDHNIMFIPYIMLIDKETNQEELFTNFSGIQRLSDSYSHLGFMLKVFDKKRYNRLLAQPISDFRGHRDLTPELSRFVGLMDQSHKQLELFGEVVKSNDRNDVNHRKILLDGAYALYYTAMISIQTDKFGPYAAREHVKLRRDLRAVAKLRDPKNKRQRVKKRTLENQIQRRAKEWIDVCEVQL